MYSIQTRYRFLSLLLALFLIQAQPLFSFELQSAWQAQGEVKQQGNEGYVVTVLFFPTETLDELNNKRVSDIRAKLCVVEALSRYLGKQISLYFSKIEKKHETPKGDKREVSYFVPVSAVDDANTQKNSEDEKAVISFNPFETFRSPVYIQLNALEKMARLEEANGKATTIATPEQFQKIKTMIQEDENLLSKEKRELLRRIEALQNRQNK